MTEVEEAMQALAAMRQSRMTLAEKTTPPSRHLAFAALLGGLVLTPALPFALRLVVMLAVLAGIAAIKRWDERRTGMFINGYRRGRTRWVIAAMLAAWIAIYSLASWLAFGLDLIWPVPLLALAATALAYAASVQWCRVFNREMAAG